MDDTLGAAIIGRDAIILEGLYAGRRARVTAAPCIRGVTYYVVRPYRVSGRTRVFLANNPYRGSKPRARGEFRLLPKAPH